MPKLLTAGKWKLRRTQSVADAAWTLFPPAVRFYGATQIASFHFPSFVAAVRWLETCGVKLYA